MPFKKILVCLDGSNNSQIAADYAFWLAQNLDAELGAEHVVDPRLIDLFIEPEFGEELGFAPSVESYGKVSTSLRKIGKTILDLFKNEASLREIPQTTRLSEGHIVEEILKQSEQFDLLVLGHRGRQQPKTPSRIMIGSVAERVAREADIPVLITVQPSSKVSDILVAFDGSEQSIGALLLAESLAKYTDCNLRALIVVPSREDLPQGKLIAEQGDGYLREFWKDGVFTVEVGEPTQTILEKAGDTNSLLILGAYGYGDPDRNVLGSTTSKVIRNCHCSVLIYKSARQPRKALKPEKHERISA
ncbi:MAG TPA: universal stress protein [Oculatellaceae cyanobacterium]